MDKHYIYFLVDLEAIHLKENQVVFFFFKGRLYIFPMKLFNCIVFLYDKLKSTCCRLLWMLYAKDWSSKRMRSECFLTQLSNKQLSDKHQIKFYWQTTTIAKYGCMHFYINWYINFLVELEAIDLKQNQVVIFQRKVINFSEEVY